MGRSSMIKGSFALFAGVINKGIDLYHQEWIMAGARCENTNATP